MVLGVNEHEYDPKKHNLIELVYVTQLLLLQYQNY